MSLDGGSLPGIRSMAWSIFLLGGSWFGSCLGKTSWNSWTKLLTILFNWFSLGDSSFKNTAKTSFSSGILASCWREIKIELHSDKSLIFFSSALTTIFLPPYWKVRVFVRQLTPGFAWYSHSFPRIRSYLFNNITCALMLLALYLSSCRFLILTSFIISLVYLSANSIVLKSECFLLSWYF